MYLSKKRVMSCLSEEKALPTVPCGQPLPPYWTSTSETWSGGGVARPSRGTAAASVRPPIAVRRVLKSIVVVGVGTRVGLDEVALRMRLAGGVSGSLIVNGMAGVGVLTVVN